MGVFFFFDIRTFVLPCSFRIMYSVYYPAMVKLLSVIYCESDNPLRPSTPRRQRNISLFFLNLYLTFGFPKQQNSLMIRKCAESCALDTR